MANNKKKSAKTRSSKAKASKDDTDIIQKRIEKTFARCTIELAEDLEQRFKSTYPPKKPIRLLPRSKLHVREYSKVSNTFNAGLALVPKATGIKGLSRWHVVLDKMVDALDIITKKGNEGVQYVFIETIGEDHRQLLCSILCTMSQMFQKMSLFPLLKAWSKASIAADPTYFKGYAHLVTALTYADDNWELALEMNKKAYETGIARGFGPELTPTMNRMQTLEAIVNGPKKEALREKRDYVYDNRGVAFRFWQDMGIPRPPRTCNLCYTKGDAKCSKCRAVYYCSRRCQILDYKEHKQVCVEPSKENLIETIDTPNFPKSEIMNDEEHWAIMKQGARQTKSSLMIASSNNCCLPAVKRAMMEGGDVNESCPNVMERPIMLAALRNEPANAVKIVRTLIQHGACPNVVRGDGQHLLAICRGRARWIDDTEPSQGNIFFRLDAKMESMLEEVDGCEKEERRESEELVELVTSAIQQHKLCKFCKARKSLKGYDAHLKGGDLTDHFLRTYESKVGNSNFPK